MQKKGSCFHLTDDVFQSFEKMWSQNWVSYTLKPVYPVYSRVANNRVKGINRVKWEMMIYMSPCKKVINV